MSVGLARLEALQVKQQPGELIAAQDVLVTEGELQDILHRGMYLVVEGLVPLGVTAIGHHLCLGMGGRRRGQPQLHIAVSFGH